MLKEEQNQPRAEVTAETPIGRSDRDDLRRKVKYVSDNQFFFTKSLFYSGNVKF